MLADLLALVDALVRDESARLTAGDKSAALELAISRYSSDRPRHLVEDVVSAGGDTLPLPAGWEGESELVSIEYPIGQRPICLLPASIYTAPAGRLLRLGDALPAGADARCTFTARHVVSAVVDTVIVSHREGVAAYAAALLLEELSAAAINDGDSTISADTTDRRTKAQEYASRARALKTRYADAVGLAKDGAPPSASGVSVAWGGRQRLTNGIRRGR